MVNLHGSCGTLLLKHIFKEFCLTVRVFTKECLLDSSMTLVAFVMKLNIDFLLFCFYFLLFPFVYVSWLATCEVPDHNKSIILISHCWERIRTNSVWGREGLIWFTDLGHCLSSWGKPEVVGNIEPLVRKTDVYKCRYSACFSFLFCLGSRPLSYGNSTNHI